MGRFLLTFPWHVVVIPSSHQGMQDALCQQFCGQVRDRIGLWIYLPLHAHFCNDSLTALREKSFGEKENLGSPGGPSLLHFKFHHFSTPPSCSIPTDFPIIVTFANLCFITSQAADGKVAEVVVWSHSRREKGSALTPPLHYTISSSGFSCPKFPWRFITNLWHLLLCCLLAKMTALAIFLPPIFSQEINS